jgi:hypothetical protein
MPAVIDETEYAPLASEDAIAPIGPLSCTFQPASTGSA